jgi:scyllo-inositol 2-dehydrogenase (NADP+)
MPDTVLRVAVLGQGRSGYDIHVRWLRQATSQFKIVAIADQLAERRQEAADQLGCAVYDDYRKLLKDKSLKLDLVVNALPSFLHPKGSIAALNAGYHVVCEKPAARSVKDFDKVVAAANAAGKLILPFQNSRFYPFFQKMREVIASGKLGKIVHIRSNWSGFGRRWDWQMQQEFHGGNLLNTGPHPVDQAIILFGEDMPKVFARLHSECPWGDADNFSQVVLYGPGKPTIEIVLNSFQAFPMGDQYNVSGTYGGMTGSASGLKWKYFDPATAPTHSYNGEWSEKRSYCRESLTWIEESWAPTGESTFEVLSRGFYDNAYDIIVNNGKRIITLEQVRRQVAVMEEAWRQNRLPKQARKFLGKHKS